jgi:hypothetical protein
MSDVGRIVELFAQVFQGEFSPEWWRAKYLLNPAGFRGEEGDVWVAEAENGSVVGHWGVLPEKLKLGSQTVEVAQAVDAATDPNFRGLGIFKTLVKNVCSDGGKRYKFIYGYPNELYRGYEKLGWNSHRITEYLQFVNYDGAMKNYFGNEVVFGISKIGMKTLRSLSLLGVALHSGRVKGLQSEVEEAEDFPDDINDFWRLSRVEHKVVLERNLDFLHWRFSKNLGSYRVFIARSNETGRLVGYMVTKKTTIRSIPDVLDIVDMHTLPQESRTWMSFIEFAVREAKKEGLNIVRCRMPSWNKYADFLRKLRFVPVGTILELAGLYQPRLITYSSAQQETVDLTRWFYTLADTDFA